MIPATSYFGFFLIELIYLNYCMDDYHNMYSQCQQTEESSSDLDPSKHRHRQGKRVVITKAIAMILDYAWTSTWRLRCCSLELSLPLSLSKL